MPGDGRAFLPAPIGRDWGRFGGPFFLLGRGPRRARVMIQGEGRKAVVLLSGGLDSMVCAALAREAGYRLLALTIDYRQRHRVELDAARGIADVLGAEQHIVLPLDLSRFGGSALTGDGEVPKNGVDGSIPVTYVPARNTIFLAICLGLPTGVRRGVSVAGKPRSPRRGRGRGLHRSHSAASPRQGRHRPRMRAARTRPGAELVVLRSTARAEPLRRLR